MVASNIFLLGNNGSNSRENGVSDLNINGGETTSLHQTQTGNTSDSESESLTSYISQFDNPPLAPVTDKIYNLHTNTTEHEGYYSEVPKFVQVWVTLITCTLMIAVTLVFINRTKRWCREQSCKKCSRSDLIELNSDKTSETPSTSFQDETLPNHNNSHPKGKVTRNGHSPRPREHFSRRPSGPFGDETIAYADESYKYRTKPAPTDKIRYLTNFKPLPK